MRTTPFFIALVLASAAGLAQQTPTSSPTAPRSSVQAPTYEADIRPIIQANCVSCHRAGGIAPFALETYDQVASRARLIALVTAERVMPPWMPGGRTPPLKYERKLTNEEVQQIALWASKGATRGASGR